MSKKQSVAQRERAREAAEMKINGLPWHTIAEELGYKTEAGPRKLVETYFSSGAREQYRMMHPVLQERGERLWRETLQMLGTAKRNGDVSTVDKSIRRGQEVLTYLARINGLFDGPQVTVNVDASRSVESLRQQFREIESKEHPVIESEP